MSDGFIYGALRKADSTGTGMIVSVAMDLWAQIGNSSREVF